MDPLTAFLAIGILPALLEEVLGSTGTDDDRYGWDPMASVASISPFSVVRKSAGRPVAVAPGTGAVGPGQRLASLLRPFSIHPPQVLADGSVYAVVDGPFWSATSVEASKAARRAGMGLQIEIGLDDEVSLSEGSVTPTVYRFVPGRR